MPGTRAGGLKAAAKIKAKDPDHFKKAGAIGGASRSKPKGFGVVDNKTLKTVTSKGGKNKKKVAEV